MLNANDYIQAMFDKINDQMGNKTPFECEDIEKIDSAFEKKYSTQNNADDLESDLIDLIWAHNRKGFEIGFKVAFEFIMGLSQ